MSYSQWVWAQRQARPQAQLQEQPPAPARVWGQLWAAAWELGSQELVPALAQPAAAPPSPANTVVAMLLSNFMNIIFVLQSWAAAWELGSQKLVPPAAAPL